MTDAASPSPRRVLPDEAEASLREILQQQITGAQTDIEGHLADLRRAGDGASLGSAENQLQGLSQLQRRIAHAGPGALVSLRAEVTAYVAASQVIVQQAASMPAAQTAEAALQAASDASRREVAAFARDFYERKIFEPYLRFASSDDEQEYRKREAKWQKEIADAAAKHTPEGDLLADKLSLAQLKDAGVHGANRSPEYQKRLADLSGSTARMEAALGQQPDGQAKVAQASPDPLDQAAPAHVSADILASLRAAGVVAADPKQDGHGISRDVRPVDARGQA